MVSEPGSSRARFRHVAVLGMVAALATAACNAAVGAGLVVLVGGAGYFASQCYDRVRVRVREEATGNYTCEADVTLSSDDSESLLRPCYSAALTSGTWRITARREGFLPASTELQIAEHEGDCQYYTHSVELTLRSETDPSRLTQLKPAEKPPPPAAPTPPLPAAPAPASEPAVPTGTFELVPADAGAPRAP